MGKKGISPLIATVLILGFTVALGAVIMTWGTKFVDDMQTSTKETADVQMACATDVSFELQNVCWNNSAGDYKITVANNGDKKIDKFKVRFYKSSDNVQQQEFLFDLDGSDSGVDAFGIEADTAASGYSGQEVYQVEVIPVITLSGNSITCAQSIDKYGDVENTVPIVNCTA